MIKITKSYSAKIVCDHPGCTTTHTVGGYLQEEGAVAIFNNETPNWIIKEDGTCICPHEDKHKRLTALRK